MADIEMPQLGETVTEGTITKWFKNIGDQIQADEPLFEVSTDKVDSEVPAPAAGFLTEILVPEGDTVDVGTKLGVIADQPPGEGAAAGDGAATAEAPAPSPAETSAATAEAEAPSEPAGAEAPAEAGSAAAAPTAAQPPTPPPSTPAAEPSGAPQPAPPTPAPTPAPSAARAPAPAEHNGAGATTTAARSGALLSPVVRRLISEHNLNPDEIIGTGAGGRITRNDVLKVVESKGGAAAPASTAQAPTPAPAPSTPAPPAGAGRATEAPPAGAPAPPPAATQPAPRPAVGAGERDTVVPFTNIRRRTAEHMVMSKQVSAHAWVATEIDFEAVDRVRQAHKDQWRAEEGFSLTYLPFISRAVIDAIREFPHVNASVGDNELVVHNYVNLGIAVDLDFTGLIVPVVHDADGLRLRVIAREVADLANRARAKKLGADEIVEGTFTITNPGPFGSLLTGPIINQPQVAILSTDGIKRRPVVVEGADGSEAIAIHSVGNIGLTWDHRAFDGAYAAAFIHRIGEIIATRDWEAEL